MNILLPILVGTSTPTTMQSILSTATEVLTWFTTSMASLLTFITENPVVLLGFMIFIVGAAVSMLLRIWKSV